MAKRFEISDAIVIAGVSATAYWLAFLYESSYLSYFNFPSHLTEIAVTTILVFMSVIAGFLLAPVAIANLIAIHWPNHVALQDKIIRCFAYFILVLPLFLYGSVRWLETLVVVLIVVVFEIAWPLIFYRGTLRERIIQDENTEAPTRNKMLFGRLYLLGNHSIFHFVWFFLISSFLAMQIGSASANGEAEFLVLEGQPDTVVVRAYHNRLLCVRADKAQGTFLESMIIPIDKTISFRVEKIGSLKPEEQ